MSYEYKIRDINGSLFRRQPGGKQEMYYDKQWKPSNIGWDWDSEFTPLKVLAPDDVAVPPATTTPPLLTIIVEPVEEKEVEFVSLPVGNAFRTKSADGICFKLPNSAIPPTLNDPTKIYPALRVTDLGPASCVIDGGKVTITPKKQGGERFNDASQLEYGTVFKLNGIKGIYVKVREGAITIASGILGYWSHSTLNSMSGTIIGKAKITMGGVE